VCSLIKHIVGQLSSCPQKQEVINSTDKLKINHPLLSNSNSLSAKDSVKITLSWWLSNHKA